MSPENKLGKKGQAEEKYILKLYVSDCTVRSVMAIENIRKICADNLQGRCDLEVIDIYQHPEMAKKDQIIAVPTLVKDCPLPRRYLIGTMSITAKVLSGLDIKPKI